MAEAAKLLPFQTQIAPFEKILAGRGLYLPTAHLQKILEQGRAAFFFDGLDEVNSLEERAEIVAWISDLMTTYARSGNRFVCTSRPAAVQIVDMPKAFKTIQLHGLTDDQMRSLATKVMSARINIDVQGILNENDLQLIEKLLADCSSIPGIKRIAKNPLLLTLLVLIYANSGAPSAKRHRIYTQAVKTLVSVRNRRAGSKVLSESDLRKFLGSLALSIFRREMDDMPTYTQATEHFAHQYNTTQSTPTRTASQFLQEIAESTGLLQIHQRLSDDSKYISFMHYSFLEYYAAIGFLAEGNRDNVRGLSKNPRWKDVITLMVGLSSENDDVTSFVQSLLHDTDKLTVVTRYNLVFSLDCALETEVPPEELQIKLAESMKDAIERGPALVDSSFRDELAKPLGKLLDATGSEPIKSMLIAGLTSGLSQTRAAYLDLIAKTETVVELDLEFVRGFEDCLSTNDSLLTTTCMSALERRPEFRTSVAKKIASQSLNGSLLLTYATLKAMQAHPALAEGSEFELEELIHSKHNEFSSLAATILLSNASQIAGGSSSTNHALSKYIGALGRAGGQGLVYDFSLSASKETIADLLSSPEKEDRLFGLRLLPWIAREARLVHDSIFDTLRSSEDREEIAAALISLKNSRDAFGLITISDTDFLCSYFLASTRDVRLAAVELFAKFPSDERIVGGLIKFIQTLMQRRLWNDEFQTALGALANHAVNNQQARDFLLSETFRLLPKGSKSSFGPQEDQDALCELLQTCRELPGYLDERFGLVLKELVQNFRTPEEIRAQALQTFAKLIKPSESGIEFIVGNINSQNESLSTAAVLGTVELLKNAKKRIEHINLIHRVYPKIVDPLLRAWGERFPTVKNHVDSTLLKNIRKGLLNAELIEISYSEFTNRMAGPSDPED